MQVHGIVIGMSSDGSRLLVVADRTTVDLGSANRHDLALLDTRDGRVIWKRDDVVGDAGHVAVQPGGSRLAVGLAPYTNGSTLSKGMRLELIDTALAKDVVETVRTYVIDMAAGTVAF